MRIHLLAPPNAPTTAAFPLDGFVQMTRRFAEVLRRLDAEVILYGAVETDAPCSAFVPVLSDEERTRLLDGSAYQYAALDNRHALWTLANTRMIAAVAERKQPRDFLCTIGGTAQQPVSNAHPDLMCVEYSIGYAGSFAPYRVFESRAWQHWTYGSQGIGDVRFFDAVIPCFFDSADFPMLRVKEDFLLYVGRLTSRKGIGVACDVAKAAGVPLKVIGHGDASLVTYGDYLGPLSTAARNDWMARARAVLCPTTYLEPFNQVAVEAQLCGTPVITTIQGGFTETVQQGVTGFRCAYLGEFVEAVHQVAALDPWTIRQRAIARYSLETAAAAYQRYFDRLALLWADGWQTVRE